MAKGRAYPPELHAVAVRLYQMCGRLLKETAAEIGGAENSLGRWVRQARIDEGEAEGLTSQEKQELRALRKENCQ